MIRPRRSEDLVSCLEVLRAVHVADRYSVRWPRDPARWLTGRAGRAAWVSESAGAIDGHLSLHGTDEERAHRQWREAARAPVEQLAVVSRFFVAPDARRRGAGSALMGVAEEYAATRGLPLVLDVADHNLDAIAFYERRGWTRIGTSYVPLEDGRTMLPVVLLVRR